MKTARELAVNSQHFTEEAIEEMLDIARPEKPKKYFSEAAIAEIRQLAANPYSLPDTLVAFTASAAEEIAYIIREHRGESK